MSEIKSRLLDAVKVAMRAQDKPRLTTLRLALADIKRVEVDERIEVDDARALLILDRMIKQRRDAQRQFSDAGRQDLAEVEAAVEAEPVLAAADADLEAGGAGGIRERERDGARRLQPDLTIAERQR